MKVECEEGGDSSLKRSVRDSGYDCWDSERSDSLSPPRHTRDNSLDSLDSFGSRSQHSPSPDVVNRGSADGRGSDSEADGSSRRPDVRKDDMLARRTASGDSRISVPFNQFLPNRTNASSYIPTARRRPHTEEGEQRRPSTPEGQEVRPPSPNIILRCENDFLSSQKSAWDSSSSDVDEEAEVRKVPDVRRDDLASRRAHRGPVAPKVHQFVPAPACSSKDRERWEGIRRSSQQKEKEIRSVSMSDILNEEEVEHLPPLSQSRNERMHEPYNNFEEDDDHWQNDLARWKNRRRSASQELIKKEEERKRIEKRMKEEGGDGNKRKSIKTYKEIVEEKERREAELCDAYRNAASPEEAAMVLQRYALRFTISDATLDSLKLPRSKQDLHRADKEHGTSPTASETRRPPHTPEPPVTKPQRHRRPEASETNVRGQTRALRSRLLRSPSGRRPAHRLREFARAVTRTNGTWIQAAAAAAHHATNTADSGRRSNRSQWDCACAAFRHTARTRAPLPSVCSQQTRPPAGSQALLPPSCTQSSQDGWFGASEWRGDGGFICFHSTHLCSSVTAGGQGQSIKDDGGRRFL
uniref:DUF4757 domain-containing protein n=1 Tax=Gasterosteus aculeatus aculeatus TaxID=481459 RepID=G3PYD0_GASAC